MPVDRPTFSESWYRVADLRPRLRSTVQIHRQHFRGEMWHVLQDPANNQFFRMPPAGYRFVALLDGRRTVSEAWRIASDQLGDAAPTQGEAIQLLGQLYVSNLLQADLPPDAEGLFRRYSRRIRRELQSHLMNLLFIRIPVLDPDRFLDRWAGIFGWVFSWPGLAVWVVLVAAGLWSLAGRYADLAAQSENMLAPDQLPLLALSFWLVKIFHEFGHAFACKRYGRREGSGGEVHVMGIMLLVFAPLPYVDASSAWALRRKWHRAIVGAAGMFVELAIAAVAAVVWAHTAAGSLPRAIAFNVLFIASVSTLLFNGNPLLRFDGYYILSDLVEIPNLYQRARDYLYYLVRRYGWRVRQAHSPAHTAGERAWFVAYGLLAGAYRIYISFRILLFLGSRLPRELLFVAVGFGLSAAIAWIVVPAVKFVRYLATSPDLMRVRPRAVLSSLLVAAAAGTGLGLIPAPQHCRVEGVVEPVHLAIVHMATDGFLTDYLPSGSAVRPDGPPLVRAENPRLEADYRTVLAQLAQLEVKRSIALVKEPAAEQILREQIKALTEKKDRLHEQRADLELRPSLAGTWVAPTIDRAKGAYLKRGDRVGLVASLDETFIRATAGQDVAAVIIEDARPPAPVRALGPLEGALAGLGPRLAGLAGGFARQATHPRVEVRVKGRPDIQLAGTVEQVLPAGQQELPSAALGYAAGGATATAPDDPRGRRAAERFFEIRVRPEAAGPVRLLSGQRVIVRFDLRPRPLALQVWRSLLQVIQKRFHI